MYRRQGSKPSPWKRNLKKKVKWLSKEALQITVKRREVKSKGEKERYTHLNAEFQGIARRDKAFHSDQCKEIEENNRMGKTRDIFKKIRDTKRRFHAKIAPQRTQMVWTYQQQKILRRGGKNTQKNCTKTIFTTQIITHLGPDILECEVKWALESITTTKLVEMMEFQLSYFKSAALTMPANLENSAVATGLEKLSFHSYP